MLGTSIRVHRLKAGLSREELAHLTQLSVRTIANIETGRVGRPHSYSLRRLADALDLTGVERDAVLQGAQQPAGTNGSATYDSPTLSVGSTTGQDHGWTAPPPRQLPTDVGDFTGRADEVRRICAYLTGERLGAPAVAVISGQAGVGKTTTAVRVAHTLAEAFPDGQLFADLRGLRAPQDPAVVLGWFLRAMGVDATSVPVDISERTALFRSLLAHRRVLIVLDDAVAAEQVRMLLPGSGPCASLISSRDRLDALESGHTFELGVFSPDESLTMLAHVVTAGRVEADLAAARDIVRSCGHLPLAVRIAAARLAARPDMSLRSFASGLADERRRLDQLRLGDLEVRASIELSYAALDENSQVALRRLSMVNLPSFSAWIMAPLVDGTIADTAVIADQLAERRLLEVVGADPVGAPRYRLHDLVRLFAARHLQDDDAESERSAALQRLLGLWSVVAATITECLPTTSDVATEGNDPCGEAPPQFLDDIRRAFREWFRLERINLGAAVAAAAAHGLHKQSAQIASSMASACILYGDYDILAPALEVARGACRQANDRKGEATAMAAIGRLRQELCDPDGAYLLFKRAYTVFEEAGDRRGQAYAAVFTADSLRALQQRHDGSDLSQAARWAVLAQDLTNKLDDPSREIDAAYVLGKILAAQGRLESAQECFELVLAKGQELGKPIVRCHALYQLGRIARRSCRLLDAIPAYREAFSIAERQGDRRSVAFVAYELASAEAELGDLAHAVGHAERAVDIYQRLHVVERLAQAQGLLEKLQG